MATTSSGLTPYRLLAEELLHESAFGMRVMPPTRTTSLISPADSRHLERLAARFDRLLDESSTSASNFARVSFRVRCFGPTRRRDERQLIRSACGGEFDLRFLGGFLQPLPRELVVAQVDALLLLELVGEIMTSRMSKSSPPRTCRHWWISPRTRRRRFRIEISNVPPQVIDAMGGFCLSRP